MDVLRGLDQATPARTGRPAVTLGFFDGVHVGHRRVIQRTRALAASLGAPSLVLTFENHPAQVLRGSAPPLITNLPHRLRLFELEGVDRCLLLRFDEELAGMEAEDFARRVLAERVGARAVVLGFDSRFGAGARGDAALLGALAGELGDLAGAGVPVQVESVDPVLVDGRPVSSTELRRAIAAGELERAAAMLGRPVDVFGVVERGDARGRELGFPTANLNLLHEARPPRGVYAGRTRVDGRTVDALVNIGRRPTFHPEAGEDLVEVHLLDFQGDLYGRELRVRFHGRLRDERRFASVDELVARMRRDRDEGRALLARVPPE